ncbi:MAG: VWA domain-containing protein [Treponema sp.]|nr:VWA domain-containing protein [Treponema sp.]
MKLLYRKITAVCWTALFFLAPGLLEAEDKRSLPLDLYLIIDGSSLSKEAGNETAAWISREIIDRILQEGDSLTIWSAGDKAQIVYSGAVEGQKQGIKDKLRSLNASAKSADFAGALREAASRASGDRKRLAVTIVVSGSAEALAPALEGGSAGLFRWSRVDEYAGWQALVVAPGIGDKVKRAAAAYMGG